MDCHTVHTMDLDNSTCHQEEIEYYRDSLLCFVPSCKKYRRDFPNSTYLSVPKSLQATWCQTLEMNCPKRNLYVCDEHINIEEDCYKTKSGKLRLKNTASLIITKTYGIEMLNDESSLTPYPQQNTRDTISKECLQNGSVPNSKTQQKQPKPKASASAGTSSCNIWLNPDSFGLKVSAPAVSDGPDDQPMDLCRFCAEYSKDCVDVTNQDRPYLTRNKTTLALNDLTVELDFNNDALPKTVCGICDRKLQAMYDFFKQVKDAQESLIKVNVKDEIETVIVKTECECVMCEPTPKDKDEIDSKDGIIDSLTVTKTEVVRLYCNKRKSVEAARITHKKPKIESKDIKSEKSEPETQKKPNIMEFKDIKSEECQQIIDIKKEIPDMVNEYEDYEGENPESDTETDVKPSVSGLATSALVNDMSDSETFS